MAIIYLYVAEDNLCPRRVNKHSPQYRYGRNVSKAKDFFSWGAPPTSNSQLYDMEFREVLRRIVALPNLTTLVIYVNDDRRRAIPPALTGRILVSTINRKSNTNIPSFAIN